MGLLWGKLGSLDPPLPPALLPLRGSAQRGKAHFSTFTGSQPQSRSRKLTSQQPIPGHTCFLCCCSEASQLQMSGLPSAPTSWQLLLVVGSGAGSGRHQVGFLIQMARGQHPAD